MVVAIQLAFVVNYHVDKHKCLVQPLKLRQFFEVEYHDQTVSAELTPPSPCMKLDNKNSIIQYKKMAFNRTTGRSVNL